MGQLLMIKYRLLFLSLSVALWLALSGFQTTTTNALPVDIGSSVTTIGQYALLAWLIVRSEQRITEQQKAWRDERRYMMDMLFKRSDQKDEN